MTVGPHWRRDWNVLAPHGDFDPRTRQMLSGRVCYKSDMFGNNKPNCLQKRTRETTNGMRAFFCLVLQVVVSSIDARFEG